MMFHQQIWQNLFDQPLTTLVTAIGLGAITVSALGVFVPKLSPNIYGLPSIETDTERARHVKESYSLSPAQSQKILLQSLNIRNTLIGMFILVLNSYWQRNVSEDPEKAAAIRTCLGIFILIGSSVPVIDCLGACTAAFQQRNGSVGRKAATVHALRTVVWLVGGIWCLWE